MKIKGKFKADVTGFSLKHNEANNARFAVVTLGVAVDASDCADRFGESIKAMAFGSYDCERDDEGGESHSFSYASITPRAICEHHQFEIEGVAQDVQPKLKSIKPIKDSDRVNVEIEIPMLVGSNKETAGALAVAFGECVTVRFNAKQIDLPLGEGRAPGVTMKRGKFGNQEPVTTGATA